MSFNRIKAILLHESFIMRHSYEIVNDIIIYPLFSIVVLGFLALYLVGVSGGMVGKYVLLGIILWQIVSITQYSIAVGCLWDVWAKNLTNIFIAPVSTSEYLLSYTISGTIKALFVVLMAGLLAAFVFHFNILELGLINLACIFVNLVMFAFALGIFNLSLIFRFGTQVQALSWGLVTMVQPLMAVIYPVSILPPPLRQIAYLFPVTYVFEAARSTLVDHRIHFAFMLLAFVMNLVYVALTVLFFNYMFKKSKQVGQFARLEV